MKKLICLFSLLFLPVIAFASEDLIIKDSSGEVRFVGDVDDTRTLEFSVVDKNGSDANGSIVTLKNIATGETVEAKVVDGKAVFSGLSAGSYTVTSAEEGIVFLNIELGLSTVGKSALTLPILGGLAGAGGITAIVLANTDGNGSPEPLSPSR